MDIKKERIKILKGIEDELKKMEKNKEKYSDFENRILELKKEKEKLKKELLI